MATNPELNITKDVIDLDLSVTKKKQFRFNKNDNQLVEINIADMGIMKRLSDTYPKFEEWIDEMKTIKSSDDENAVSEMANIGTTLNDIDMKMRTAIDYIFNAPVSAAAAPEGTMYDLFNGQFRFEHIIELLLGYFENNISTEFKKMQKHVSKYKKKDKNV